jgi:hypothetical protein
MRGPPPSRSPGRRKLSRGPIEFVCPPTLDGDGASRPRFFLPPVIPDLSHLKHCNMKGNQTVAYPG